MLDDLQDVYRTVAEATGHAPHAEHIDVTGPRTVLPSAFDVTGLATAALAAAGAATARLLAARRDAPAPAVSIDTRAACATFAAEGLFTPIGWTRDALWDPIAGDYRTSDGWIRLHTNYDHHRRAVERVLAATDRDAVVEAVRRRHGEELQEEVVAAGGAAAVMRTRAAWVASPAGAPTADLDAVTTARRAGSGRPPRWADAPADRPLDGVRVLDLTRVIAGPDCTGFLAAFGADVLRVDPPGFQEVPALPPTTTVGKATAFLDLTSPRDRRVFETLLRDADVLVAGYREGALGRLGYDDDQLAELNPDLIVASVTAYGDPGPWRERRGFDSLVQMSSGICAAGAQLFDRDEPTPLPVQALDHSAGHLLACAVVDALTRRLADGTVTRVRGSLVGAANLLWSLAEPGSTELVPRPDPAQFTLVETTTAWGPARRVPMPVRLDGVEARWRIDAGPLGRHPARWPA